ncbi:protein SCAR3-like isoform X3 [Apium graveolens]|uniref:protein SCAR3-like isoform X3 n=1 Tax=Apium graveolens TaxID=4045 RepID=UPI003D7BCE05
MLFLNFFTDTWSTTCDRFAADVFHGLQEQATNTSSRSHKLMIRARKIEAAVSPLEKSILAQRSHLHFAYTTGSRWHADIQSEQNHFIYSDLPMFVMDSYEKCRSPPRLHLLDKFDTGGPGSCLNKYSDPTFFRKASAGFDETYAENFSRHKKACKRKKKRTWVPNGDNPQHANHGTPTSSHSGRLNYASQNLHSPSQTISTDDDAVKFEIGSHLNSSDSRTATGQGEYVFNPSCTLKFDGREPEEISSQWTTNNSDTLDTFSLTEQIKVADDDIEEQTGARSSCITWDEKTEIVEPTGPQYYSDVTMEEHPTIFDPILLDGDASNLETDYCSNKSTPKSFHAAHQLDEYESDTDIYMDSRNTMDSESETDLECQTKREVKQLSDLNTKAIDNILNRINPEHMESNSAIIASQVPGCISTNVAILEDKHNLFSLGSTSVLSEETSTAKPISVSPECHAKAQSPCYTGKSSILDSLPSSDLVESNDITTPNIEIPVRNLSSFDSRDPIFRALKSDTVLSSVYGSKESPSVPSGVAGTNFWTNGGLLGLQPSKPPDFSALSPINHESMASSSRGNVLEGKEIALETNTCEGFKMSKQNCSTKGTISHYNDRKDSTSILKTSLSSSQTHLDSKHERTANFHHNYSQSQNLPFSETSIMVPGTEKQDNSDIKAAISLGYCDRNSSQIELSSKLLENGQGKVCSFSEDNPPNLFTTSISEQKNVHQEFQNFSGKTFIEQFGSGSPFVSPSSSPPLEHMKIFFQPIQGFEVSKLKLDFDGSESFESSRGVFPSFQLVPEESHTLQDIDSDSDDTFCDSSPHRSADCLSHYSISDSEEWKFIEYPTGNDGDIYDALCRNSVESVSSNPYVGRIAPGVITNISGLPNLFYEMVMKHSRTDLPSFDTLHDSIRGELHNNSEAKYEPDLESCKDPTLSPSLPPIEWSGMNQNPDMVTENQVPSVQALKHAFDQKILVSAISQKQKLAPVEEDSTGTIVRTKNRKHSDGQKLNLEKDANQSPDSKVTDENEDFLQQIKAKSLTLRRTVTKRPNLGPGVPTNVSVTAILEKANAIRQAVGSDVGEDNDSWSD